MWSNLARDADQIESRRGEEKAKKSSLDDIVENEMKSIDTTTIKKPRERVVLQPVAKVEKKEENLDNVRQETAAKETQVRTALAEHQLRVRKEAERLARVESELRKLSAQEQADIGILRSQLEDVDRKLHYLEKDFHTKEAAYQKAKEAFNAMEARKRSMHEHLALMVLSSEKRKEEKLNELLANINAETENNNNNNTAVSTETTSSSHHR